jgi:hypothetical protein
MSTRPCEQCGGVFSVDPRKPLQKYCGRACWRVSRLRQVTLACQRCGKAFSIYQARGDAKFCSWECRKDQVKRECPACGQHFEARASAKRLTCSRSCLLRLRAREGRSPRQGQPKRPGEVEKIAVGLERHYAGRPEIHWNYKGGPGAPRGPSWNRQRRLARDRDGHACRLCGRTAESIGRNIPVHHIKPFREFGDAESANHLDNLVCLCQSCHMKVEHGTATL